MAEGGASAAGAADAAGAGGEEHALANEWVLYEHRERVVRPEEGYKEDYLHQHLPLFTCATVEEFWKYWPHIAKPSQLFSEGAARGGSLDKPVIKRYDEETKDDRQSAVESFAFFKKGVQPAEEATAPDGRNYTKGQLHYRCGREVSAKDRYDKAWETIVLGLLGETFDERDFINGARFVDKTKPKGRPMVRVEIWLSTDNEATARVIGDQIDKAIKEETGLKFELRPQKKRK